MSREKEQGVMKGERERGTNRGSDETVRMKEEGEGQASELMKRLNGYR